MSDLLNLLFVDDDDDIRTIVEMALARDPAMILRSARCCRDAIHLATDPEWRPDVFLLDVMMPGTDGIATLRSLRLVPGLASTPVLFITAKARDADISRYRAEGTAGVILKPFDPLRLSSEIRALIGQLAEAL